MHNFRIIGKKRYCYNALCKLPTNIKGYYMKKLWLRLKYMLYTLFQQNDKKSTTFYLSQSDKRWVLYWSGMICLCSMLITLLAERHYDHRILNTVAAYIASATDDEYEKIAWNIRHDLVYSDFGKNAENIIRYIPNTSNHCPTCSPYSSAQAVLVCTNTGEYYILDVYSGGFEPDTHYGAVGMSSGYDEISQTELSITRYPDQKRATAELRRKGGIVSIHKMKTLFCDDCIQDILKTLENNSINEFVIWDTANNKFYPVNNEITLQIGDYSIVTSEIRGDYVMTITYNN